MKLLLSLLLFSLLLFIQCEGPKFGHPQTLFRGLQNMTVSIHSVTSGDRGEIIVLFNICFSDKSRNYFTRTLYSNDTWSKIEWVIPFETSRAEESGNIVLRKDHQILTCVSRQVDVENPSSQVTFRERHISKSWEGGRQISDENTFPVSSSLDVDQYNTIHVAWLDYNRKNCSRAVYRRRVSGSDFDSPRIVSGSMCNAKYSLSPFVHAMKRNITTLLWVANAHNSLGLDQILYSNYVNDKWQIPVSIVTSRNITMFVSRMNKNRSGLITIWHETLPGLDGNKIDNAQVVFLVNGTWTKPIQTSISGLRRVSTAWSHKYGGYWILHGADSDTHTRLAIERRAENVPGRTLDQSNVVAGKFKKTNLAIVENSEKKLAAFWVEYDASSKDAIHELKYAIANLK